MKRNENFQSNLAPIIVRYLALKRALGRDYDHESYVLRYLDSFLTRESQRKLTSEVFALWCKSLNHLMPGVRRSHMRIIRNFCLYQRRTEPRCFVPDELLFPAQHQVVQPYIFSQNDVWNLLQQARRLRSTSQSPFQPFVFASAITLLYTTGMRRGELLRLKICDYDPEQQTLLVRSTKFHKSRILPLSADGSKTIGTLFRSYKRARELSPQMPLLWNGRSLMQSYTGTGLGEGVRRLLAATGIRKPTGQLPRVHDFRHTFAVHALLRWYRSGADVQAKLPLLATYMGHISIVSTEYYLRFAPSLTDLAIDRFHRSCGGLIMPDLSQKEERK
ncbi:tyrosine-type recombinase/integrase [bacterium]|nr:tyrosine-type recombinase/integrase [bacterium]